MIGKKTQATKTTNKEINDLEKEDQSSTENSEKVPKGVFDEPSVPLGTNEGEKNFNSIRSKWHSNFHNEGEAIERHSSTTGRGTFT